MKNEFTDFHGAAADIVAAYVYANEIEPDRLPELLQIVFRGLQNIDTPPATVHLLSPAKKPAVPIKDSIHNDYLVCLEDGAHLKMLKRYLKTNFNMTFEQYRLRWNLPHDYPAVAPSYTKKRSQMAKDIGLGRKSGNKKKKK
jgi:predicted transcriptional regulator